MRGTIGVVFDTLYRRGNTILGTLEVDYSVMLLVTTTNMAGSDAAIVVATTIPGLLLQQGLIRSPLVQILAYHTDDMSTTGGSGFTC